MVREVLIATFEAACLAAGFVGFALTLFALS
ncbi:hypothetical protein UFOVP397_31 [uncultured Caudovirales phage]|uniref:Uncharacterized protein n=1 Tax=uncultured Caudovirales phage TaxID=2100421 RepID=A0A6J5LZI2_9CAUD|nr:hypothetical protein UFOVP397_31 [uncultured Caudovirales phage]